MFRKLGLMLASLIAAAGVSYALVGHQPLQYGDEALIDQRWVYGVAAGQNFIYQNTITAHAGGTQTACLILSASVYMNAVSVVANSGDSVCLPYAVAGESVLIANQSASNPLDVYAQSTTNAASNSLDTINGASNSSAYAVSSNTNAICFAAANGLWNCIKGS